MRQLALAIFGIALGYAAVAADGAAEPAIAEESSPSTLTFQSQNELIEQYCVVCHNETARTAGLSLEGFDVAHADEHLEVAEKMIRKLQAGMMPPNYAPQLEGTTGGALALLLSSRIDELAAKFPNPGRRTFQRLNRAEYARSVRDLLAIDVDVTTFLPPDTVSHSFDNIADVQSMSATLLEGFLRAASQISRAAIGEPNADAREVTYKLPRTASQTTHVEGAPIGTRGGISVIHSFPADGEYVFKMQLHGTPTGFLFGTTAQGEQLEISVNGERVALLEIDPYVTESSPGGLIVESQSVFVKAGPHRVSAAFIEMSTAPIDDLMAPIEHTLADTTIGRAYGLTALPHLRFLSVNGPHNVTGVSDTPSRRKVFTCRPTSAEEELPCANRIVARLARQAYRRPLSDSDFEGLMSFYRAGRADGDFESGIRTAIQAILVNPQFVFRLERQADVAQTGQEYRVNDLDLASRLSFFLWAAAPDDELLTLASEGALNDTVVLEEQVERMLADPRSEALATRFAGQWLRLQDLEKLHPDALLYPQYDQKLSEALRRETELFFDNLVREDRSLLELLTADYTFVNERVANHYGIPNVTGNEFRRVTLDGVNSQRRGVLGHGSVLTLTAIADRTSIVQRGKWVLEVLIGTPPPPPPPDVDFSRFEAATGGKVMSVRQAMEMHRSNPACSSCHSMIDPIGLALENFDVTGAWRVKDNGNPIDASGQLYDGSQIDGPLGLRDAILKRSDSFIMSFTGSLMTYGLGRRVEYYDMPAIRKIAREAGAHNNRISYFIKGVVASSAFRMGRVETTDATEVMMEP